MNRRRYEDHPTAAEVLGAALLFVVALFTVWLVSVLSTPL